MPTIAAILIDSLAFDVIVYMMKLDTKEDA